MVQNPHLAKRSSAAGWAGFRTLRTFKAASASKRVGGVDPAFTSQACSGCGAIVAKGLSVRWHQCPDCGASLQRDHNAAQTILRLGQEQNRLGYSCQASPWAARPSVA